MSARAAVQPAAPPLTVEPIPAAAVAPAIVRGVRDRRWLVPLLVFFAIKQVLLVAIVGPFTGHDEVDHFYYIARLAAGDGLGEVGEVELPDEAAPYRRYVADYPNNAEVIQPPLYHGSLAVLHLALPGGTLAKLYALRLVSLAIGLAVVWIAYLTARLLFPGDVLIRAGVPVFVAFQPQFSFEAAIVNHDILLILLFSLVMYALLRGLRDGLGRRGRLAIGLLGGAGLWTKASFGLALPVVAVGVFLIWRRARRSWWGLLRDWLVTCGLPLLLASPWFVRSFVLYGDPTGAQRLREIPEYGDQAQGWWEMISAAAFWRDRLHDFWGNYGWRLVPFDLSDYRVIAWLWAAAGFSVLALLARGLGLALARRLGRRAGAPAFSAVQRRGLTLMGLSSLLLLSGVVYVGTIQFTQSRFIFPAMIGIATLSLVGVDRWLPARVRPLAVPVLVVALMALNAYVSLRYLIPYYYGPGGGAAMTP